MYNISTVSNVNVEVLNKKSFRLKKKKVERSLTYIMLILVNRNRGTLRLTKGGSTKRKRLITVLND